MLSGFFGSDDLFLAAGKSPSGVPKDIQYVEDKYFGCGPLAGLHAALGRAKHDILFVTSCDMPLVDHRTADALLPLFGGHDAVVPKTACGKYHPLTAPLSPWQNVDLQRDEVPTGAALFSAGEPLTPAHIGVLAAQGIDKVDVFRRPKAAILSTGSELVPPGGPPAPGRIYNSNLYLFRSLLLREGYQIDRCASLPDDAVQISDALGHLAQGHDLILTTGGASVGDRDHAGSALEQADADILFSHIRMKPGSCCFAAVLGQAVSSAVLGIPARR